MKRILLSLLLVGLTTNQARSLTVTSVAPVQLDNASPAATDIVVDFDAAIELVTKIKEIVGSDLFNIELLETYQGDILDCYCSPLNRVVVLPDDVYVGKRHCKKFWSGKYVIGFMPITEDPIVAYL